MLVRAMKTLQRTPLKALFNITSNDPALVEAAKEAGAKDEWLMPAKEKEEEEGGDAEQGKGGGKAKSKKDLKKEETKKEVSAT